MARKRMKGCKYRRVSQQQKYIFLKLCITQKQSIHQAAYNAGIHYSTAKTILFFHKKNYKNYSSYYVEDPNYENQDRSDAQRATYKNITIDLDQNTKQKTQIKIIVNSKDNQRDNLKDRYMPKKRKLQFFSDEQSNTIKVEACSEEIMRSIIQLSRQCIGNQIKEVIKTQQPQLRQCKNKEIAKIKYQLEQG